MPNHESVHLHPQISHSTSTKSCTPVSNLSKTQELHDCSIACTTETHTASFLLIHPFKIIFYFNCSLQVGGEASTLLLTASHAKQEAEVLTLKESWITSDLLPPTCSLFWRDRSSQVPWNSAIWLPHTLQKKNYKVLWNLCPTGIARLWNSSSCSCQEPLISPFFWM